MSLDQLDPRGQHDLTEIEDALDGMTSRVQTIVAQPSLTQDTMVELLAIYNNAAYVFLYLEAVDDMTNLERLLPRRDVLFKNPEVDRRVLDLLLDLRCPNPEAERSRELYVAELRKKEHDADPAADERIDELLAEARTVIDEVQHDQHAVLERIGGGTIRANPAAVFHKLMGDIRNPTVREKLARTWAAQRDRRQDALTGLVDEMIAARRASSARNSHGSVLARTLTRCRVSEANVESFLERYLTHALRSHEKLASEIRDVVGDVADPMVHFQFAMRTVFHDVRAPKFALDDCLAYIFSVARDVFGITLRRTGGVGSGVTTVRAHVGGQEVGLINFDPWRAGSGTSVSHTTGLRNRTEWSGIVQRPVAYVSCPFRRDEDGVGRLTFQNVHSLFHEFGHAVNHLLIRKRISMGSGLEHLPPERLEHLSMWFEKWVYHPEFGRHLPMSDDDRAALKNCVRIKMIEYRRTYVERAVAALMDFHVHRRPAGGLRDSFERLDEKFGVSRCSSFGDFPAYFTWPMYMAHPGANFSYLWGAADSCHKFLPFLDLTLDEIAMRPWMRDAFASCFDFDMPSAVPDSAAVFAFYDPAVLR
jgi:oligopeptidase A